MLKSTENTFSREQFRMLRKARGLITEQFQTEFSLHADEVISEVYRYAVRSESNELFRLFTDVNALSGHVVANPLNEEQFILLREAKHLIEDEFHEELPLVEPDVMDRLFDFSLRAQTEALYDIFRYLLTRDGKLVDPRTSGAYFLARKANQTPPEGIEKRPSTATELIFAELSAPDFERLREAKVAIEQEFGETLSLHCTSALDDLYSYALKSADATLFELFCDLRTAQGRSWSADEPPRDWMSVDQYRVLCEARSAIKAEFDIDLDLRSPKIQAELYEYSLQAAEESLFAYCRDFHGLCVPEDRAVALPSKDEFKLLRRARSLVAEEFSESLALQADVVEYDLYLYAIRSDQDELFDLYSELMDLPGKLATTAFDNAELLLAKEEYVALRTARRLIDEEFNAHLALESENVLDELYRFALDSEAEELFDIHASLNAGAVQAQKSPEVQPPKPAEEKPSPEVVAAPQPDSSAGIGRFFRFLSAKEAAPPVEAPDETPEVEEEAVDIVLSEPAHEEPENESLENEAPEHVDADHQESDQEEPDHIESQSELAHAESEDEPKLDMITRAMQQKNGGAQPAQKKKAPASEIKPAVTEEAATKPDKTKSKLSVSLPPLASSSGHSDIDWYIATSDDQFRLRIINEIYLSASGELLLVVDESEQVGATIKIERAGPVLRPASAGILVNGEAAADHHLLEDGDHVAFGDRVLRLESASEAKVADRN